ncbi:MAG: DUF1236 domain-containing protein [Hyphomicrobiaceae bacterium]|nr:DUF1236 domain-containing protein [Hyphomicrobiaceae bacterium]
MLLKRSLVLSVASIATMAIAAHAQDKPAGDNGPPPAASNASPKAEAAPSARDVAPGQTKDAKKSAREMAPGQTKSEGDSARDEAPGMKKQGKAEADGGKAKEKSAEAKSKEKRADKADEQDSRENQAKTEDKETKIDKKADGSEKAEGAGEKDKKRAAERGDDNRDRAGKADAKGDKGSIAELSTEQKSQVKSAFSKNHAKAAKDLDISVNVGVVVPRSVKFYPVPQDIIVIAPAYRDYLYFVVGDEVCIVDPDTYEIVDIIVIA